MSKGKKAMSEYINYCDRHIDGGFKGCPGCNQEFAEALELIVEIKNAKLNYLCDCDRCAKIKTLLVKLAKPNGPKEGEGKP